MRGLNGFWVKHGSSLLAVGLAIVVVLLLTGSFDVRSLASKQAHHRKPYEYVYLDRARVNSYLGQLDEGDVKSETRTASEKSSGEVDLEVKALGKAAGSLAREKTSSAVVSKSEADNFYKLERELKTEGSLAPVALSVPVGRETRIGGGAQKQAALDAKEVEARAEAKLERQQVGTIVKLEDAHLRIPPYLAAYPSLRYASLRFNKENAAFGAAPLAEFDAAQVSVTEQAKAERLSFVERAGVNPRLPFSVTCDQLTIVIPARYAYLTGDPSLLGANVTVVGKLVYKGMNYGDAASVATYLPALFYAKRRFLRDIGFKTTFLDGHRNIHSLHVALFEALQRSLTFTGRSVEIIPIAIYS